MHDCDSVKLISNRVSEVVSRLPRPKTTTDPHVDINRPICVSAAWLAQNCCNGKKKTSAVRYECMVRKHTCPVPQLKRQPAPCKLKSAPTLPLAQHHLQEPLQNQVTHQEAQVLLYPWLSNLSGVHTIHQGDPAYKYNPPRQISAASLTSLL